MSDGGDTPHVPGGYLARHRLGSGQTSHVYLAEHARHGRVALKLPRSELEARPVLRRMFESEVMITLRLAHPRVVQGLDGHPTGAGAFLALEMCPGGTLDQLLLEKGRLPLETSVRLVEDVAEGLAYTHEQKVLHRDVKPANVFLTESGRAKLGDFGTGVFMVEEGADRVGTAFYMAPEIFEGSPAGVRSDVYGLGVLAYEVLTGERPFRGDTYDALMHAHLGGLLRDPTAVRPDLPKALSSVVRTAMARRPERRFATVNAFLAALREATPGFREAQAAPAAGPPSAGRAGRGTRSGHPTPPIEDGAAEGGDGGGEEAGRGKRRGGFWSWFRRDK